MTFNELVADIALIYDYVGVPFLTTSSDSHVPDTLTTWSVIVYETGLSEVNKKPVISSKYVNFVVYLYGDPGEEAYYADTEPVNTVNSDITGTGTLEDVHKLYVSESIRGRVQAAVAFSAQDVLNESLPMDTLASNAASGQNIVIATKGFMFWPGKVIVMKDDNNYEEATILNVIGNTLTLTQNLTNTYTTAANGIISYLNDTERQQWAANALINPDAYTLSMTSLVAMDPTVQAAGGLVTDVQIDTVVDSFINKLAAASYL
jgi:hypothetical protein